MAKPKLPSITLTSRELYEAFVVRTQSASPAKGAAQRRSEHSRMLNMTKNLFKEQYDFIADPSRRKAAICSRRSGKSYAAGRYLIKEALENEGTMCVYIARTREAAKRILWRSLKEADQRFRIGIKFNNADLVATFPNNSQIMFTGANDASDVDKLRGAAFSLAVLDEAAFFNINLRELVNEVLTPALLDRDGSLVLISTPNSACTGFFYDITEKSKYNFSVHRWTVKNNPHMTHAVRSIEADIKNGILDPSDASYKREYLGLWVRDNQDIVYEYGDDNLLKDTPESNDWEFVLGIDLGYHDATAFVVAAWSPDLPYLYFVDEYKQTKMLTSEVEEKIHAFMRDYNFSSIVMDTGGGSSKMLLETFKQRSGLPVKAAKKTQDKLGMIKLMNSDLKNGTIKVAVGMELLQEWDKLQYNKSKTAEDRRFDNHLSDAALYAWTESRHFLHESPVMEPEKGSSAYFERLEERIADALLEKDGKSDYDPDLWGEGIDESDLWVN
jgi:PBSX family phage terminase large subunit